MIIDYQIIRIISSPTGDSMFQNIINADTWIVNTAVAGGPSQAACSTLNPSLFSPNLLLKGAPPISSTSNIVYNDTKLHQINIPSIPINQIPISSIPINQIPISSIPINQIPISSIQINQIPIPSIPITSGACFSVPSTSSFNTFRAGVQLTNPAPTYPTHQVMQHEALSNSGHPYPMFSKQVLSTPHIYANTINTIPLSRDPIPLSREPIVSISSTCSSSPVLSNQSKMKNETSQQKNPET